MDAAALQIPRPQAATSAIERQVEAGAARALVENAPALASGVDRVEAGRRDHQRDCRGEQKDRHQRGAAPGRKMKIDRRGERHFRRCPRQRPHGGKLFVAALGLKFDHATPITRRRGRSSVAEESRQRRMGRGLRLAEFDHAPVVVDEDRLGEPLVRVGLEHISEDFGLRALRIGHERRVEPLSEQGGADVNLARGVAQRQIALEPKMLERQRHNANNCDGKCDPDRRRNDPPATARGGETQRGAFERLDQAARPRQGEAKPRLPAQASGWPFRTSVPVCRAYTRHRPSQTSPQITLGQPPSRPNHYDKNPCANLCPDP